MTKTRLSCLLGVLLILAAVPATPDDEDLLGYIGAFEDPFTGPGLGIQNGSCRYGLLFRGRAIEPGQPDVSPLQKRDRRLQPAGNPRLSPP